MNRKQRRQNKIVEKDPVLCIKKSEFDKKLTESYEKGKKIANSEAIDEVMTTLLVLPCLVLSEKYGWGMKKRLPEFAELLLDEYEKFTKSSKDLDQWQEWIYENLGIKFVKQE